MLNFHSCFMPTGNFADDTYLNNLALREPQENLLRDARRLIRDTLRAAFKKETAAFAGSEKPISPNFFTQGSWAYKTINRPSHIPPQQTDMDDGCYLPMTFIRGANPRRAASWFYEVADKALVKLVTERGWKGYDNSKATCCRVIVDQENHVDVPLYAIRDDQFVAMMKALTEDRAARFSEAVAKASEEDDYTFDWSQVTGEDVLLAQRNGVWKPSNPREVSDWAISAVAQMGEQLRRTWRSLKGWRDNMFPNGEGPSSIALMVMIADNFTKFDARDDLAVRAAAVAIRDAVVQKVEAPWNRHEDLCEKLKPQDRALIAKVAQQLVDEIDACMQGSLNQASANLKLLGNHFGQHFCEAPSRVREVTTHATVQAYAPIPAVFPALRGNNRSA
jgi:hypothetical protein